MLFSEFADIMYKHSGSSYKPHEYFLFLFDTIMEDATTPAALKKVDANTYNPFGKLKPDTLDRLFLGSNPLNPKRVHAARELVDSDKFANYIDGLRWESQRSINEEFKKRLPNFNENDNLGYSCADLFIQIMDDIYDGHETSSPIISVTTPMQTKTTTIPAATVFYNEKEGKIQIGETSISIPKELAPPSNIASEEEIYIQELLSAYADVIKVGVITKNDLTTLPTKYQRHFTEQRINYYSAIRIDRFVRKSIINGDEQAEKWKSGTYDYISDTLWDEYDNGYRRLLAVLKTVVSSSSTSVVDTFQNLVGAKERKGVCHLLANDGIVHWVNEDE